MDQSFRNGDDSFKSAVIKRGLPDGGNVFVVKLLGRQISQQPLSRFIQANGIPAYRRGRYFWKTEDCSARPPTSKASPKRQVESSSGKDRPFPTSWRIARLRLILSARVSSGAGFSTQLFRSADG
ncbi:hypothetical protein Pan44_38350 [Caulifigura coniformis]|uniref:Uncharacterized protein n=1 Tax=Caulifigura coniformis TaxID=2527983 RepID=A0A517SI48_9PLAN|nr:hypothetical protein Pan44_38350 [Caulifigura coniformis]